MVRRLLRLVVMKTPLIVIVSLASTSVARADVFDFKDLEGYEKCMQLDHLVETVMTPKGAQTRLLGPEEIQVRCVASATKLLAQVKKKDMALDFIKATTRLSAPENAVALVRVLVDLSLPACNELAAYEVMLRPLSQGFDSDDVFFARAKSIIKSCLKDKAFKKDFLEEKDSGDPVRAKHACEILVEEKIVKSCKAGTP